MGKCVYDILNALVSLRRSISKNSIAIKLYSNGSKKSTRLVRYM